MDEAELNRRLDRIARRRLAHKGSRLKADAPYEPVGFSGANVGALISYDEMEFGREMERWMRENRRMPTTRDALAVAIQLGYRKVADASGDADAPTIVTPS